MGMRLWCMMMRSGRFRGPCALSDVCRECLILCFDGGFGFGWVGLRAGGSDTNLKRG